MSKAPAAARRAGALRLLDLPTDLLQTVARHALPYGSAFAFASRTTMGATAAAWGLDNSIFAICTQVALTRIARAPAPCDQTRLLRRMRLVQRALKAGHGAELFCWPAERPDGPRPSPLREFADAYHPSPHVRATEHAYPMEHNLDVGLAPPAPMDEIEHRDVLRNLYLWDGTGGRLVVGQPAVQLRALTIRCINCIFDGHGRGSHATHIVLQRDVSATCDFSARRRAAIRLVPEPLHRRMPLSALDVAYEAFERFTKWGRFDEEQ